MSDSMTRPTQKEVVGVLAFLMATWLAFVVVGLGVGSLLLDRDVITDSRAGVGLGPAMVLGALIALSLSLVSAGFSRRRRGRIREAYVLASVLGALAAYVGFLFVALLGWLLFVPDTAVAGLLFTVQEAIDWPAAVIVLVSFVIGLSYFAMLAWRSRETFPVDARNV